MCTMTIIKNKKMNTVRMYAGLPQSHNEFYLVNSVFGVSLNQ